jgi:hypothetical protein
MDAQPVCQNERQLVALATCGLPRRCAPDKLLRMRRVMTAAIGLALMVSTAYLFAQAPATNSQPSAKVTATQAPAGAKPPARVGMPPIPTPGFAPARPVDQTRAVYEFAAQHPEVLKFVPCYCGCESSGHPHNESCFVKSRDAKGNVTQWDTHGFG